MAEHSIDDLIDTGDYDLALERGSLDFRKGDRISYAVVEGGTVQQDGSVPVKVRLKEPARHKGQIVKARLVPQRKKSFAEKLLQKVGFSALLSSEQGDA